MLVLLILFYLHKVFSSDDKTSFRQYTSDELRWLKNNIIYPTLEGEIQSLSLNPSDDKCLCYQNGSQIYSEEIIRTSDIENLHKELSVNGDYLKNKLQVALLQQYTFGQVPNLNVIGMAVQNGKFIIAMELIR